MFLRIHFLCILYQLHLVKAQNYFNASFNPSIVYTNEPLTIGWYAYTPASLAHTVSIFLQHGALSGPSQPGSSYNIETICSAIQNTGTYIWTPASSLEPGDSYWLAIQDDTTPGEYKYGATFAIARGSGAVSSNSGGSVTSAPSSTPSPTSQTTSSATSALSSTSDLPSLTRSDPASSAQSTLSGAASTSLFTSPTQPQQNTATRLSTGAAVGIGIGATLGVLFFAVICFFAFRVWKRKRQSESSLVGGGQTLAELGLNEQEDEAKWRKRAAELRGEEVKELGGDPLAELEASKKRESEQGSVHELDGSVR